MSNSSRRSYGRPVDSAAGDPISSVQVWPAAGASRNCTVPARISFAATVIGSSMASQREDRHGRALRRANIRMRLGGEPGIASQFPDPPKGMHQRTYERLRSAVWSAEIAAEEELAIFLERLKRVDGPNDGRRRRRSSKDFWT
jgi:hypothetical protein